jgi:hypothetical protein
MDVKIRIRGVHMKSRIRIVSLALLFVSASFAHAQFLPGYPMTQSMPQNAQNAQNALNRAATFNTAMGAGMLAAGMMQKPPNTLIMLIGMMSLMQGMQAQQDAQQAGQTAQATAYQPMMIPAPPAAGPRAAGRRTGWRHARSRRPWNSVASRSRRQQRARAAFIGRL